MKQKSVNNAKDSSATFVIWNPSLRKHVVFCCSCRVEEKFGICLDSNRKRYKLLGLSKARKGIEVGCYDLYTGKWTNCNNPKFKMCKETVDAVVVDGFAYWLVRKDLKVVVVYCDMEGRRLLMLEKQPVFFEDSYSSFQLVTLKGRLCSFGRLNYQTEIWEFRGYWVKMLVVPTIVEMTFLSLVKPLGLTNNGQLLMEIQDGKLAIYDSRERTLKLMKWFKGSMQDFKIGTFVDSLLLCNEDGFRKKYLKKIKPCKRK